MSLLSRWHVSEEAQKILLAEALHNGQLYGFILAERTVARNNLLQLRPDLDNPVASTMRHLECVIELQFLDDLVTLIETSRKHFAKQEKTTSTS
jgi:hypothetical protein